MLPDGINLLSEPMFTFYYLPESNFTASAQATILYNEFENPTF